MFWTNFKTLIGTFSRAAGPVCEFWANPVEWSPRRQIRRVEDELYAIMARIDAHTPALPPAGRPPTQMLVSLAMGREASFLQALVFIREYPVERPARRCHITARG